MVSARHRTERRVEERRRGEKIGLKLRGQLWTGGVTGIGGGAPNGKLRCALLTSVLYLHSLIHDIDTFATTVTLRCNRCAPCRLVLRGLVGEVPFIPSDTRGITRIPFLSRALLIILQAFSLDPLPYVSMESLALRATKALLSEAGAKFAALTQE